MLVRKNAIIAVALLSSIFSFSHVSLAAPAKRQNDNRTDSNPPPPRGLNDQRRGTELIGAGVGTLTLSLLLGYMIRESNRNCRGTCDSGAGASFLIVGGVIGGVVAIGLGSTARDEGLYKEKKYREWEKSQAKTPSVYLNYAVATF